MEETILNVAEVAESLSCSKKMIYKLCKIDPTFPYFREGRKIRFRPNDLRRWVEVGWIESVIVQENEFIR